MRLLPTYKAVIKKSYSRGKMSRHVQGGKIMTVNFIQTGTHPTRKGQMFTLGELRGTK